MSAVVLKLEPAASSGLVVLDMLATLPDLLEKVLAMLATLSLRIMEDAPLRTRCSPRPRTVMPGKGKTSRVQTSESSPSSLARSDLDGVSRDTRFGGPSSDSDLCGPCFDDPDDGPPVSFSRLVFLSTTWQSEDLGPTVVARCIDILRAIVPGGAMSVATLDGPPPPRNGAM